MLYPVEAMRGILSGWTRLPLFTLHIVLESLKPIQYIAILIQGRKKIFTTPKV